MPGDRIVYIGIGSFRYIPTLKKIIENRFPDSKIPHGEFVTGIDNKMRYFESLRIKLYKALVDRIRQRSPETLAYFCMEDEEVWRACFGFVPEEKGGLGHMLDENVIKHCGVVRPVPSEGD